jgi:hypothetical protein
MTEVWVIGKMVYFFLAIIAFAAIMYLWGEGNRD